MPNQRVREVSRLLHRTTASVGRGLWTDDMVARNRNGPVTTSDATFRVPVSAKTNQAWKYPKGIVQRHSSKIINGRHYVDPKDSSLPRRKHESNFLITINTNKGPQPGQHHDDVVRSMEQVLMLLAKDEYLAQYLKFGPKDVDYREDRFIDVIEGCQFKGAVEVGDIMHRIHAHIMLTVYHYSQVQIEPQLLANLARQLFNANLPVGNPYRITARPHVHVRLLPQANWVEIIKGYVHKGMNSADGAGPVA